MGGGGEEPTPRQDAVSGICGAASHDTSDGFVEAAARARAAREAADAEALAASPFLAEALDRLQAAIRTVAETRWSTHGPAVLAGRGTGPGPRAGSPGGGD